MALGIPEGYEEIEEEEVEAPEGYEPIDEVEGSPGFLWRNEIMSELDEDPETRLLAMQMLDTEGGGAATMEALVNRTAMIREKVPGWGINDELNSGFYGPINKGIAQNRSLDPDTMDLYQQEIDKVRAGSNIIEGRTDQGSRNDPNVHGPGRVHVPGMAGEVYNYWTGKRAGVEFTHQDSAEFANKVAAGGASSQPAAPEGYEEIPEEGTMPGGTIELKAQPQAPEGYEEIAEDVIPLEPVAERPGGLPSPDDPTRIAEEKAQLTPKQAQGTANREKLQSAIAKVEKEGYTVPHFIGLENEPEGDRAPTRDMEQLVATLATQQTNAVRARDLKEAARIGKERAFWEEKIKKEGMSAEQWKKQTGEEDPRYPHEPAYTAKQSPEGFIDMVDTAIKAGKENWEKTNREEGAFRRGVRISTLGLGETINRYAYSPIVHGIREAIDYIAPGSDLAKGAKKLDDAFYENTVAIPARQREALQKKNIEGGTASEIVGAVGTMAGDLPTIMLTGGLLPELKVGMELVNRLRHGAAAMTVPAMRAGTDAAEQVKKAGGSEMEQLGAFIRGTTITMGIGAVPMATKSGAASMAGRLAERAVKSVPLASAAVESGRMLDNAASDLFGGEKRPFSVGEHLKQVAPLVLVGGVAGRDTRSSKFERTFGFNPVKLDKVEWMRRRMDAEGIAKVTPEKVAEWEVAWKETQRELPTAEEAPPVTPEAARPAPIQTQFWYSGTRPGAEPSVWVTPILDKAISYAEGRRPGGRVNVFSVEQIGKAAFGDEKGNLMSPEEYVRTISDETTIQTGERGGLMPEPIKSLSVEEAIALSKSQKVEEPIKRSAQALGIVASPKAAKGFEQAREEAKAIADYLNKAEHWGPYNSAIGGFVASSQKAQDNAIRQQKELKAFVPDESERKGITMYREADGDMAKITGWGANVKDADAKAAYRSAGALTAKGKQLTQIIADRFNAIRMHLNAEGIDVAERENYITHMLHTSGLEPTTGAPRRSVSSFFRYAKPRTYDSFFQAFQAGEKPKTLDAVDILTAYELTAARAINNKKLVDRLKFGEARDGRPILAKPSVERPDYVAMEDIPGLTGLSAHPEHAAELGRIFRPSAVDKWLNERTKNPLLNISKGVLQTAIEAQKYMKGTMFSFSFFHQLTEGTHAVGHRVNPFKTKTQEINLNDPQQFDAAKHGLMLRPDRISMEQFMHGVGAEYNLVTRFTRKFGGEAGKQLADIIDGYSHYLFEDYIPRIKMDTYNHIVERNMARFGKDLESGKVTPAEVKSLSADQANAAYGHLNYTKMGRSATARQLSQIIALAPDFFEARARFAGQAIKGAAGVFTGSKTGTEQLVALAVLGIGQYAVARILNYLDHGDPEYDPKHAFQVKTDLGGILPDKRWVGLRSVPEDLHNLVADPGQFFQNRLSPFARLAFESVFKTNWRHERTHFTKSLRDMLANTVPMPMQGWAEAAAGVAPVPKWAENFVRPDRPASLSPMEMLFKSTGIQIHRVSPINDVFEMKDEWLKVNNPEEYERQQASVFPASRYRALRYALEDSNWEAARTEAKKLREGGATTQTFQQSLMRPFTGSFAQDQKLYQSLSKEDKAVFDAALRRRIQIIARYKEHVNPRAEMKRVTVETLHKKMREAEAEEREKNRKKRAKAL